MYRILIVLLAVAAISACGSMEDDPAENGNTPTPEASPSDFEAYCQIDVDGVGTLDVEEDYLPHVIQCENDGAGPESLRAQAITARSYAYYKIDATGSVTDGQGDQVYSCGKTPQQRHFDAVAETAGQFLMYQDTIVAAFYVAGSDPGDRDTCIADSGDPDPTGTEKFVTYNEGLAGQDIEQTTLGWVNDQNWANRGCMSQWGSRCLEETGQYGYDSIVRFYYGSDILRVQAAGPCVPGSVVSATAQRPRAAGKLPAWLGPPARRIGAR